MRRLLPTILLLALVVPGGCAFLGLSPSNEAPTAVIAASPATGRAPLRVQFDGSASHDDGTISNYAWQFGDPADGPWAEGTTAEHEFRTSGVHTARLRVTDEVGLSGEAQITITVENTSPLAGCRFSSDSPTVGEWVVFDASMSYDPDGRLVDFTWDFGDGTSTRGTQVGHAFEEVGVYAVRLTIEDDAGATATLVHTFTVHLASPGGGGCGGRSASLRAT